MKKLDQLKDWMDIKNHFLAAGFKLGDERKESLKIVYPMIRDYYYKYHQKYDPVNPPTE